MTKKEIPKMDKEPSMFTVGALALLGCVVLVFEIPATIRRSLKLRKASANKFTYGHLFSNVIVKGDRGFDSYVEQDENRFH